MPPQVYDSAKEFKLCGAGLVIAVNGQAALEAINPELRSRLQVQGRVNVPSVFYDASGGDCLCCMYLVLMSDCSSALQPAAELCNLQQSWHLALSLPPALQTAMGAESTPPPCARMLSASTAGTKKEPPAMGGRSGPVQGSPPLLKEAQLPVSTGWFELHQGLFDALPKGVVELGRSFSGFEERADGVLACSCILASKGGP